MCFIYMTQLATSEGKNCYARVKTMEEIPPTQVATII